MLFSEFWKSKDQKYYKDWAHESAFVCILGFIFYGVSCVKANLHNEYIMLTLFLAHYLNKIIY